MFDPRHDFDMPLEDGFQGLKFKRRRNRSRIFLREKIPTGNSLPCACYSFLNKLPKTKLMGRNAR